MSKNHIKYVLTWLWAFVALLFVFRYLYVKIDQVLGVFKLINVYIIYTSSVFIVMSKLCYVYAVKQINEYKNVRFNYCDVYRVYTISQLGKYIPGCVWHHIARVNMYSKYSPSIIIEIILLEIMMSAVSSMLFGLSLAFSHVSTLFPQIIAKYSLVFMLILLLALVTLIVLSKSQTVAYDFFGLLFRRGITIRLLASLLLVWIGLGGSFWILVAKLNPGVDHCYVLGLYALAYCFGLLVPIAPAGIGVREGILVIGLVGVISQETAVVVSILHRIIYLLVEVILFLVTFITDRMLAVCRCPK